jgi:hypothetical protein
MTTTLRLQTARQRKRRGPFVFGLCFREGLTPREMERCNSTPAIMS